MKKAVKRMLHGTGLLPLAEKFYFDLKLARPELVSREIDLRTKGAPDGLPLPHGGLVFDVIASHWKAVYFDSGREIVDDMAAILKASSLDPAGFGTVLDFGCGCGRLIRHVGAHTNAALYGTDYNPDLIAWCRQHLPLAVFDTNDAHPPLRYDDSSFDFVYARSIFTHFPGDLQNEWMGELRRVLRPGGVLYFTMHGHSMLGRLSAKNRRAFEDDQLVVSYSSFAGKNLCSTYASKGYVDRRLSDGFQRIAFVEGRADLHLSQDVHIMRLQ